jgi:hypothetical protein
MQSVLFAILFIEYGDNMKFKYLFIFLCLFAFTSYVNAEDSTCTITVKNELVSEAMKVEASYNISYEGEPHFEISIYNITPNIYVSFKHVNGTPETIIFNSTNNGTYTFNEYNLDSIFKYTFEIYPNNETGCSSRLLYKNLTKPKKNKYADLTECSYEKMKNYTYCKEWISYDFLIDEDAIIQSIKKEAGKTSTTKVISNNKTDEDLMSFKEFYLLSRKYLIIGLSIGIVIDLYCLYLSFRKVRENIL